MHFRRVEDRSDLVGPSLDRCHVGDRDRIRQAGAPLVEHEHPCEALKPSEKRPKLVVLSGVLELIRPVAHHREIEGTVAANLVRDVAVTTAHVASTTRLHDCRLPAAWDQVAAGFASGMGPPLLPVMGPP